MSKVDNIIFQNLWTMVELKLGAVFGCIWKFFGLAMGAIIKKVEVVTKKLVGV